MVEVSETAPTQTQDLTSTISTVKVRAGTDHRVTIISTVQEN